MAANSKMQSAPAASSSLCVGSLARIKLFQGRFGDAMHIIESVLREATEWHRNYVLLDALILKSLTFYYMKRKDEAYDLINQALKQAEQERFKRIFLDNGHDLFELIRQTKNQIGVPPYGDTILLLFESYYLTSRAETGNREKGTFTDGLTRRETEVLLLLARRYSNQEIGEELFISLPTVKSHVKHILQKLSAGNRKEAVQKAGQIGLLDQKS